MKIDPKKSEDEKLINSTLFECIDNKKSFIFNAGAGAGKTYSLVECLKYICREQKELLEHTNQKVICITYTNVAAEEVKSRLGNNKFVEISTIHDRLWELIKSYQEELVKIHYEKMANQIQNIEKELEELKKTIFYDETFVDLLLENQREYYHNYRKRAADFKNAMIGIIPESKEILGNVKIFKDVCNRIIKIDKYRKCISKIKAGDYKEVIYDSRNNRDSLDRMKISHDTLLEYADIIVEKYDDLKRFIADSYPYFIVDEYQDTSVHAVNIISNIQKNSVVIGHPVVVGYFGDTAQNIYDTGIGIEIQSYIQDYKVINKKYNRRSCKEILDVANRVRNDGIVQESIYKDDEGGSVSFYYGKSECIEAFIHEKKQYLISNSDTKEQVHCFVLLNKTVAQKVGIEELYNFFYSTPYYKANYNQISSELLSNDINKLGIVQRYLYNICEFEQQAHCEQTMLLDIFPKKLIGNLNLPMLKRITDLVKEISGNNIKELVLSIQNFEKSLCEILSEQKSQDDIKKAIQEITGLKNFSWEELQNIMITSLYMNEDNLDEIETLINMNMETIKKWYKYVKREMDGEIVYHTFHGTKGLEYDNVIIIMGSAFGKEKHFFEDYFMQYNTDICEKNEFIRARNLLYVALTRAKQNICVLYTDDITTCRETLEEIFGEIQEWKGKE